ncbi:hypothetical protein [Streptomyces sp. NPDC127084]|uniref:hypothetical protein n=1 Tax=Streptomyces sp. NPDC127084 TaxID=3347133 RepID=UPI00365B02BB
MAKELYSRNVEPAPSTWGACEVLTSRGTASIPRESAPYAQTCSISIKETSVNGDDTAEIITLTIDPFFREVDPDCFYVDDLACPLSAP